MGDAEGGAQVVEGEAGDGEVDAEVGAEGQGQLEVLLAQAPGVLEDGPEAVEVVVAILLGWPLGSLIAHAASLHCLSKPGVTDRVGSGT